MVRAMEKLDDDPSSRLLFGPHKKQRLLCCAACFLLACIIRHKYDIIIFLHKNPPTPNANAWAIWRWISTQDMLDQSFLMVIDRSMFDLHTGCSIHFKPTLPSRKHIFHHYQPWPTSSNKMEIIPSP